MIKPISFTSVIKVNAPIEASRRIANLINYKTYRHDEEDKEIYKTIKPLKLRKKHQDVVAVYDRKDRRESYLLTDEHAKTAQEIYKNMQDDLDMVNMYPAYIDVAAAMFEAKKDIIKNAQNKIEEVIHSEYPQYILDVDYNPQSNKITSLDVVG